jgi:hypothetical protein
MTPFPRKESAFNFAKAYLKTRILVPGQGGADFQTAGAPQDVLLECILRVVEDWKESAIAEMGPKPFFEIGSNHCNPAQSPRMVSITPAAINILSIPAGPIENFCLFFRQRNVAAKPLSGDKLCQKASSCHDKPRL